MAKTQTLSFPIRVPDAMQAGRILRAQAARKHVFFTVLPLLTDGMTPGQTYRLRLLCEHFCELSSTRSEHKHAGLWLKLRTPSADGRWAWGEWSQEISLPETIFEYLALGAVTQAPTLREITSAGGSRVAVLDVILEVPASYVSALEHERRVLGWDWGVRSLITVSVLEMGDGDEPSRQVNRPLSLDSGGLDGRQARLRREIDRTKAIDWGAWLCCSNPTCGWNGARDYAASLNIAWLGLAFLHAYHQTKRYVSYCMTDEVPSVKPALYSRTGATLLLPSQRFTPRPSEGKHIYYAGWSFSIALRTSRPKTMMAVLSTSRFRKCLLKSA